MKMRFALAAAALAAAIPSGAQAAYQITGVGFAPGSLTGTIQYTPTNLNLNVGIGRLNLTGTETSSGTAVSFMTYCVDIFHTLQLPGMFDFAPTATLISSSPKRDQLLALLGLSDLLVDQATNKAETSAAIQLATWEIVNEDGPDYSFSNGTFRSSGGNSDGARVLAQSYLDKVTAGVWQPSESARLNLLFSATSQSQMMVSVPEPATWAMMIGGFGLVGAVARRRTRAVNIVYA